MHKLPLAAAYCRIIPSMDRHTCQRCNDPVAALAYRMPYQIEKKNPARGERTIMMIEKVKHSMEINVAR